ncbi:MAG: type transport system ATP-binding protein [Thermoanaerobacter sp.]|nr:type transport system ATP-binding protein [Thermoanaerobacter sp.]
MKNIVEISNLTKYYGNRKVLDSINLSIEEERAVGIMGANGAGKSTLLNCMLGVTPYDDGDIYIMGNNVKKRNRDIFHSIGVQFQDTHYQDKIKVKEVCQEWEALYDSTNDWKELCKMFKLDDKLNEYAQKLSGGEKQRLATVLALIGKPKLLILDEPTAGLDMVFRIQFLDYLNRLRKQEKITLIFVSHYIEEVEKLCDDLIMLKDGALIEKQRLDIISEEDKHKFIEKLYYENIVMESD